MAGLVLWTGSVSSDRRTALACIDVASAEVNSEQNYWQWHTDDKSVHIAYAISVTSAQRPGL